jgi:hypothetical protein
LVYFLVSGTFTRPKTSNREVFKLFCSCCIYCSCCTINAYCS